jgi:hypothetical protein
VSYVRSTSKVFEALRSAHLMLVEAHWPSEAAVVPYVGFATDADVFGESELVLLGVDVSDDRIGWRTTASERDEVFTVTVTVATATYVGADVSPSLLALGRLEQLADVVQRTFYDERRVDENGIPFPDRLSLGMSDSHINGFVAVAPQLHKHASGGVWGECEVRYEVTAHI